MKSFDRIKSQQNLWKFFFATWIYLGFIRNTIPQIANPLYFLHNIIIIVIFIKFVPRLAGIKNRIAWIYIILLIFLQFFNVLFGKVSIFEFVQGLNLYCFGMILFASVNSRESSLVSLNLSKILEISMIPNLVLCILQVPLKLPYFQNSGITNSPHLGSANGYIRAYGTFTSTTGFTLYITVVFAYTIANRFLYSMQKNVLLHLIAIAMLVMSQSRTALILVCIQYLLVLFVLLREKNQISLLKSTDMTPKIKVFRIVFLSMILVSVVLPGTLSAFTDRLYQASQSENVVVRLLNQQFSWIKYLDNSLTGDGLAVYSTAIVGYSDISHQWIEKDLERIMVESGLIMGLALIGYRIFWALYLLSLIQTFIRKREFHKVLILPVLIITFLQGPLFGQNDTNIYGWYFLTYLVSTRSVGITEKT